MSDPLVSANKLEFSESQGQYFARASYWMGIVGRLGLLFSILGVVCVFAPAFMLGGLALKVVAIVFWPHLVGLLLGAIFAVWTIKAAAAFGKIAASRGEDLEHLFSAMTSLIALFRLQAILIGIGAVMVTALMVTVALKKG